MWRLRSIPRAVFLTGCQIACLGEVECKLILVTHIPLREKFLHVTTCVRKACRWGRASYAFQITFRRHRRYYRRYCIEVCTRVEIRWEREGVISCQKQSYLKSTQTIFYRKLIIIFCHLAHCLDVNKNRQCDI